jgi:hypothetical protein
MGSNYYIFGIQRSGTNYLQQLITANFKTPRMANRQGACWKHSIDVPAKWDRQMPTFLMYKNPYLWVESMCLRNRVDWLKTQKKYPADDLHHVDLLNINGMNIVNLAKTWAHFHKTWLDDSVLNSSDHLVIKYESLLQDDSRNKVLNTICNVTQWKQSGPSWVNVADGKVSQSPKFDADSKEYYFNQKPKVLDKIQCGAITQTIGPHLIRSMGYKLL